MSMMLESLREERIVSNREETKVLFTYLIFPYHDPTK